MSTPGGAGRIIHGMRGRRRTARQSQARGGGVAPGPPLISSTSARAAIPWFIFGGCETQADPPASRLWRPAAEGRFSRSEDVSTHPEKQAAASGPFETVLV